MSRISHSAYRKYLTCPAMYKNYYVDRMRPVGSSSSLLFGTAIDEALNALLLKTGDPHEVFKNNFMFNMTEGLAWHKDDYDEYIFTEEQLDKLYNQSYEYKCWASLRVKGRMMIDAYIEEILPKITKVHNVQMELEGRKGFIDAIVELEGYGKVLLDHKTASRPYKHDVLEGDTQLHLYALDQGIDLIGFVVLNKKVEHNKRCQKCKAKCYSSHKTCPQEVNKKRCHGEWDRTPEINIQLIVDRVSPFQCQAVENSVSDVENAIDKKVFPMNLGACRSYYGQNCPYIDYCLSKKTDGLEYKPEED